MRVRRFSDIFFSLSCTRRCNPRAEQQQQSRHVCCIVYFSSLRGIPNRRSNCPCRAAPPFCYPAELQHLNACENTQLNQHHSVTHGTRLGCMSLQQHSYL